MLVTEQKICLTTEKELRIFMDPLRQRVLECMESAGAPMTAKKIADALHIAPSSAGHHLRQLASIGVVLEDHRETVHGIVATFYRLTDKNVGFDSGHTGLWNEKQLLLENRSRMVQDGFFKAVRGADTAQKAEAPGTHFDVGVAHLTPAQMQQMDALLRQWAAQHRAPGPGTVPVRYCLVSYVQ